MQTEPIRTKVGEINGVDAISVDEIQYLHDRNEVIFEGQIEASACSDYGGEKDWLSFAIHFDQVIFFQRMRRPHCPPEKLSKLSSSYDRVLDSAQLAQLKKHDVDLRVRPEHEHLIITTDRDVFEIVTADADLQIPGV